MLSLEKLIDSVILAVIPCLQKDGERNHFQEFRLRGVEPSGLWLECQSITDEVLKFSGVAAAPKTLVLFVPFSQINCVLESEEEPSLSEQALL